MVIKRESFFTHYFMNLPKTQGEIFHFLFGLYKLDLMFHLDDDPKHIISSHNQTPLFSPQEVAMLRLIVDCIMTHKDNLLDYERDPFVICNMLLPPDSLKKMKLPMYGFSFDGQPDNFYRGYLLPDYWNGFARPYMTKGEVMRLAHALSVDNYMQFHYEASLDSNLMSNAFRVVSDVFDSGTKMIYETNQIIDTSGKEQHLFYVGDLGITIEADDCLEVDGKRWEGFL